MELLLILRVLLRRWWLIVLPVAVVAVFTVPRLLGEPTYSGGFTATFRYTAAQEFNLPQRDGDYQDVWLASEFTVNAFTEWLRSSTFRAELNASMPQDFDTAQLGIITDNARSIGTVQLSYPEAATLAQAASVAVEVLQTRNQAYFPHLGGEPADVTIIDAPTVTPAPVSLPNRFGPLLQLGLALFAGLGLALLVEYLDPTLRRTDELERLRLRVVAHVPRHKAR
jgi:capsular polysaccharide biosynthesis protein